METTRYDELRTLVAANFSETTQRLVDEALAYAAECLEKQVRYDGSRCWITPQASHASSSPKSDWGATPRWRPSCTLISAVSIRMSTVSMTVIRVCIPTP